LCARTNSADESEVETAGDIVEEGVLLDDVEEVEVEVAAALVLAEDAHRVDRDRSVGSATELVRSGSGLTDKLSLVVLDAHDAHHEGAVHVAVGESTETDLEGLVGGVLRVLDDRSLMDEVMSLISVDSEELELGGVLAEERELVELHTTDVDEGMVTRLDHLIALDDGLSMIVCFTGMLHQLDLETVAESAHQLTESKLSRTDMIMGMQIVQVRVIDIVIVDSEFLSLLEEVVHREALDEDRIGIVLHRLGATNMSPLLTVPQEKDSHRVTLTQDILTGKSLSGNRDLDLRRQSVGCHLE